MLLSFFYPEYYWTTLTNKLKILKPFFKTPIFILWTLANLNFLISLIYSELPETNTSVIWTSHFVLKFIQKTARNCRFKITIKRILIRMFRFLIPTFRAALRYYRVNLSIFSINSRIQRAFQRNIRGVLPIFFIQVRFFRVTLWMFRRAIRKFRAFYGSFRL